MWFYSEAEVGKARRCAVESRETGIVKAVSFPVSLPHFPLPIPGF